MSKSILSTILFLTFHSACYSQSQILKRVYTNIYIGTIQYYGDLNEDRNKIDVRNYFHLKDPVFGLGVGTRLGSYFYSSISIEAGNFQETKSTINTFTSTSFIQTNSRIELDLAKMTHPLIPIEKQRYINLIYLGFGVNSFKSIAYEAGTNTQLRNSIGVKPTISYGIIFRAKISNSFEASVDFGHNKLYTDVFDATIGEETKFVGVIKDRKLSEYKTALDLWAGMRVGLVYHFNDRR